MNFLESINLGQEEGIMKLDVIWGTKSDVEKEWKGGEPGMVIRACNASIWGAQARGLKIQGQPEVRSETLSQKKKKLDDSIVCITW
jgi:hypothetical protein